MKLLFSAELVSTVYTTTTHQHSVYTRKEVLANIPKLFQLFQLNVKIRIHNVFSLPNGELLSEILWVFFLILHCMLADSSLSVKPKP